MVTTVAPGGSVFYNESATVTIKEVRALDLNIPLPVRSVHFRIDPFTIRIEFTHRGVDQYQDHVVGWSTEVLNTPCPPRGVVVPVVHLVHIDPL